MKKILLTNRYSGYPLEIALRYIPDGFLLDMPEEINSECIIEHIIDSDYLLISGRELITENIIHSGQRLKMIQRTGSGLDNIDLEAIRKKGIPLYVNTGINSESVAEHTLMLLLACLRRVTVLSNEVKNGVWNKQEQGTRTHELFNKTVGIIGMGKSAQALVRLLVGFDVKILYYSRTRMTEEYEKKNNMQFVSLEELLTESDAITLHCALNAETRNIINACNIGLIKNGAVFVNTARGGLVEHQALSNALKENKIAFAGLDVHEEEPVPEEYVFKDMDNVILTPHVAGITEESFSAMMRGAFHNILAYDEGRYDVIEQYRII